MNPNKRMQEMAAALLAVAEKIKSRIPDEGPVAGWNGFHTDLDEAEELVRDLALAARGIFRS